MSKLKDALVEWAEGTNSVYMTDEETGPEGVIANERGSVFIRREKDYVAVYYRGEKGQDLDGLTELVSGVDETVKLYAESDALFIRVAL
jgi:hypothetical protein